MLPMVSASISRPVGAWGLTMHTSLAPTIVHSLAEIARQVPVVGQRQRFHLASLNLCEHRVQRVTRIGRTEYVAAVQKGRERHPQQFVAAVGDDDAVDRHAMPCGGQGAETICCRLRITTQHSRVEILQRRLYGRARWIRVFVGVQLDDVGAVRLFTVRVSVHPADVVAFV